ncbi:hemerythrin domain-containing protein, partial [Myxococcota bacterium]|nr:hemerythrin domain-containing protein [Myxococcota bacterium]
LTGARALAERLREAIAGTPIAPVGSVTVSVGVAELLGQERPEEWFARADGALYQAKQSGRNRVGIAEGSSYVDWDTPGVSAAVRLVWTEHLASGEETLDDDHHQLFILANALLDVAFSENRTQSKILAQLEALLEHVVAHFSREEQILAARGYGGLRGHQRLHNELVDRAKSLADAARNGAVAPGRLVEFVARDVVADHLMKADRAFFPLFKA